MEKEDAKIIGYNIKRLLDQKGCTQLEFAKAIGEKQTTVSMWMTGKAVPRFSKFSKMADFFGCKVTDITELKNTDAEMESRINNYAKLLMELEPDKREAVMKMIDALKK